MSSFYLVDRVMAYLLSKDPEGSRARLRSPPMTGTGEAMKLEFFYLVKDSTFRDLTVSLVSTSVIERSIGQEDELWHTGYLSNANDGRWMKHCQSLPTIADGESCKL